MITTKFIESISHISKEAWEAVSGRDYPFTRHEFLSALEKSGAVSSASGWRPQHMLVYDGNILVAVMPSYLKDHSYGEFVFDFQWASAYQRHGLSYYPKRLSAIPFSPVTGPRICIKPGSDDKIIAQTLTDACIKDMEQKNISSWHVLFSDKNMAHQLTNAGLPMRRAVHFQWFNHGYHTFDDFLAGFNSRHRKNLRKERKKVSENGIVLQRREGHEITAKDWHHFYDFYQLTYEKHSGHGGYLSRKFFDDLGRDMPEQLMMVTAYKNQGVIAAALYLKDSSTLYGRYWGCTEEYDFLHFETCYYQGVEYCIEKGLSRFDPGVQGEHKIQRGFRPVFTYSNHWIADLRFRDAIRQFLQEEDKHIIHYQKEAELLLPFKQNPTCS